MSLFVTQVFSHGEYTTAQDPGHKRRKVICSRPLPSLPWAERRVADEECRSIWRTEPAN